MNTIDNTQNYTDHGDRMPRSGRRGTIQNCRASPVVSMRNPCKRDKFYKIATWNAQSMFQSGKFDNIIQEMTRLQIDILGISDTQWPNNGECAFEDGRFYYSGSDDGQPHRYGVGICVKKGIVGSILNVVRYSDRIIMIQLKSQNGKTNLIQIYAPTADKADQEIEEFYNGIDILLRTTKKADTTIILGDFNAKVGKGKVGEYVGEYGLGDRNERGDRLVEFCQQNDFVITNTWYKLPKRRLYTWTSPRHTAQHIIRNQIDFVLINKRYRNAIKSVKAYPGADIKSDHNPVVATFRMRFKKLKKKTLPPKINTDLLRDQTIKMEIKENINEKMKIRISDNNVNEQWQTIKEGILEASQSKLTETNRTFKQKWMTREILEMMDERRTYKGIDIHSYKNIDRRIKRKIIEAKEQYMQERCHEIEELEKKYDSFGIHKKIKEITGTGKKKSYSLIKDKQGNLIMDVAQKLRRWEEYIRELFEDQREELQVQEIRKGPPISRREVEYAIQCTKTGKAPGPDGIPTELLKLIEYDQLQILVDLYNTIYHTGIIPTDWLRSTFVMLPKKVNAKECSDHRTISLMSHTLKTFLKIIHSRIYKKLEIDISENQFGFRNGMGTREALFAVNVIIQKCLDMNKEIYMGFIDYEKAFDRVRHERLINLLRESQLDEQDVRIIKNLYWNQVAVISSEGTTSEDIKIQRGVRQGCVLSPLLFNYYSEAIFKEALGNRKEGIIINGKIINNVRYADDTLIITDSTHDLQIILQEIDRVSREYGLKMNYKKTKYMVISKNPSCHPNTNIKVNSLLIERVKQYQYLGTWINDKHDQTMEIKVRIEKARNVFFKMKQLFTNPHLNLQLRLRMIKCYVIPVLMYGLESWTINKISMKKLQSFEMWIFRRALRISWTKKIANEEVLRRVKRERELVNVIKARKLEYLGHIMRGERYGILRLIMEGKIAGKRSIGRRRMSWLRNLREWFGCTSLQLFRAAASKVKIAVMIANLHKETAP